jgi:serine protease Do
MRPHPRSARHNRYSLPGRAVRWGAVVIGLAAGWPGLAPAQVAPSLAPGNPRRSPIVEVVERVKDAVVNIHSERTVTAPDPADVFSLNAAPSRVNGMGTGIVIDPRGYIITNQHVVDDVQVIRVRLADGSTYPARVLARDHESDLALVKIDARKPLKTIPLGTANDLMVGETVLAIGNAYGYEHTVTTGVVSAVKRDVTLNKDIAYKSLIQTDASINPGNSGGPLVNVHGELIGVNVAIRAGAQGIGFAIPVDSMIRVAGDMLSVRRRQGLTHGLKLADQVEPNSSPARRSVSVERVESGPSSPAAGFQRGDVIHRVGDQAVSTSLDVERALLDRPAGEKVPVAVRRGGQETAVDLVLQNADRLPTSPGELVWRKLGLRLAPTNGETITRVNSQLHGGLTVTEVLPESVSGKAGIQRGDILIGLHQWETVSLDNVNYVLTHPELNSFNPLRFFIIRGGKVQRGWLPQID